jgi:hypothetical protein
METVEVRGRTLVSVRSRSEDGFDEDHPPPARFLIRTKPRAIREPVKTSYSNDVERGQYLVDLAACESCHTTFDTQRDAIAGMEFAGGNTMEENEGAFVVPNITPDNTGIKSCTAESFREVTHTVTPVKHRVNTKATPVL